MDRFTLEIITNALTAIGDEMFTTLRRTAQSSLPE
jgi:N-methylhydantoinase B/oxoprolinase/acetone carboxylase alpha subunit